MQKVSDAEAIAEWVDALDPDLRALAQAYLRDMVSAKPTDFKEWTGERALCQTVQIAIAALPPADAPIPLPVIGMVGIFAGAVAARFPPALWVVIIASLTLALWSYATGVNRKLSRDTAKARILNDAVPDALTHVTRTRTERAYRDAVRELLPKTDTGENYLSSDLRREQMTQLNSLLENGKRLDAVQAEIVAALASGSPESLRAEIVKLRDRESGATDAGAKTALAQSVALCEERLRRAETLAALTVRVEAEQEVIYQAFGMAKGATVSLRLSPTVAAWELTNSDPEPSRDVSEIAENISRQTQAVEAAVQELGIRH